MSTLKCHISLFRFLLLVLLFVSFASPHSHAKGAPKTIPVMSSLFLDTTNTLNESQKTALEKKLKEFETRKGSQLAVLMVSTTEPETIDQYALRVVSQWRLGRKGVDDGVLVLVAKDDRNIRLEVGYGLEGALNDATCKRLISDYMLPLFSQGKYYEGLDTGLTHIISVIDGEALPPPRAKAPDAGWDVFFLVLPFIIVFLLLVAGGFWPGLLWIFFLMGTGRSGKNGFKGGGGGGFGGGGASGRW